MDPSLSLLRKISSMIHQSNELRLILESSLQELLDLTGMDAGIFTLIPSADTLQPISVFKGFEPGTVSVFESELRSNAGICGALTRQFRVTLQELSNGEGVSKLTEALKQENLRSMTLYGIQSGHRIVGAFGLGGRNSGKIDE